MIRLDTEVGREQNGIHPAIVMGQIIADLVVVVPLTSNTNISNYSYTELINPSQENGLSLLSVAMIFQIRAISNQRMMNKIGKVSDADITRIDALVKDLLRLS